MDSQNQDQIVDGETQSKVTPIHDSINAPSAITHSGDNNQMMNSISQNLETQQQEIAYQNTWKTTAFRINVVLKIEDAIQKSGMPMSEASMEMENHVYQKATNKDEYLSYAAWMILHVRKMNSHNQDQIVDAETQSEVTPIQDSMNAPSAVTHSGGNNQMMNLIPEMASARERNLAKIQELREKLRLAQQQEIAYQNRWKTTAFRIYEVRRIENAIQESGMPTSKTSMEMENDVYQRATDIDEYLSRVDMLISRIGEMQ